MQGQRNTIDSLPDSINFDYGSPTTNVGIDQQIRWNNLRNPAESRLPDYRSSVTNSDSPYMGTAAQESRNLSRWNVGDGSSNSPQNLVGHDEQLTQSGWYPPNDTSVGAGLRLDVQQHEPSHAVEQPVVNSNVNAIQMLTGPAFVRGSSSSSATQNFDLNEAHFRRVVDEVECPNSSKSVGLESKFCNTAGTLSDPFASSSASGGFLLDDEARPDSSLDGRRLSCKRKTLEGNAGESSSGGSCFPREEASLWPAISAPFDVGTNMNIAARPESSNASLSEHVNPRLGLGMSRRVPVESVHPIHVPGGGGAESSRRINQWRANLSSRQDFIASNSFLPGSASATRQPEIPSVHQSLRFAPSDPPIDLMPPIEQEIANLQNQSAVLRTTMRRHMQSHRWNSSRHVSSSSSAVSGETDDVLPVDLNSRNLPRNIGDHPMFAPPVDARNSVSHPTNWSLNGGSIGTSRNTGSSSRSGPNVGPHSSAGPSWASHRQTPSQYSRRLSEYVRRSVMVTIGTEIAGQSGNGSGSGSGTGSGSNSHLRSAPASSQDDVLPSLGGSQGQRSQARSALWLERQGDGSPYLRALAAAGEGRTRLVSEIRNALDSIRRGEGLRIEDVMLLDQSVFFGMADIHDHHRDMRLDVDNLSYEELLALEERIGYVSTGLSEATILKCMKQHKHVHTMSDDQTEAEPCCVCQEVYRDGEDIGTLDCGHDFHQECIKQWLAQKNLCPICKTTGLATTK